MPGAALFLGERLTARQVVGVVAGLGGLTILFNPLAFDWTRREDVLGNVAILAAAFLWAASILHIRGHRWRSTPFDLVPWQGLLATTILVVMSIAAEGLPEIAWNGRLVVMLLYAGIPGTALAYWAITTASRSLPAVTTSLGLLATPVVSVLASTLWLGEPLTPSLVAALGLILGGIALGTTANRGRRAQA